MCPNETSKHLGYLLGIVSRDANAKLHDLLDQNVTVRLQLSDHDTRCFPGVVRQLYGEFPPVQKNSASKVTEFDLELGMNVCLYHDTVAIVALNRGDYPTALEHGKVALEQAGRTNMSFAHAISHITCGTAYLGLREYHQASSHLQKAAGIGKNMKSHYIDFLCLFSKAALALKKHNRLDAVKFIEQGLAISKHYRIANHIWFTLEQWTEFLIIALDHNIEVDYVRTLIQKRTIIPKQVSITPRDCPYTIKIHTLGQFVLLINDEPVQLGRKAPKKVLELLKALIALGGKGVSIEKLLQFLWTELDADAAYNAFNSTFYRLRKMLGSQALLRQEGHISLDNRCCWVDVWELDQLLYELTEKRTDEFAARDFRKIEKALYLYQGPFLDLDTDSSWSLCLREKLRSKLIRQIERITSIYFATKRYSEALSLYQKALEFDNVTESFYQGVMRCCIAINRPAEGMIAYQRCRQALHKLLAVSPSQETETLRNQLQQLVH